MVRCDLLEVTFLSLQQVSELIIKNKRLTWAHDFQGSCPGLVDSCHFGARDEGIHQGGVFTEEQDQPPIAGEQKWDSMEL